MRGNAGPIAFNRPYLNGREGAYVAEAARSGRIAGDGPFTARCTSLLERELGAPRVMLTSSCTSALEMAANLTGVGPGDEVIVPSFTFVSTAGAFALRGATPVFVDIRPDTLNLDEEQISAGLTERTRVIVPVHYGGVGCEMDTIGAIAAEHGLLVVEDAAQGIGAAYRGRALGAIGDLGCMSFHETKNLGCGEGGAIVLGAEKWLERAEILLQIGTNRSQFLRQEVNEYTWVDLGSFCLLSEVSAAYLLAQLEAIREVTASRRAAWAGYHERLAELEHAGLLRRPIVPEHCAHNGHTYHLLLPTAAMAKRLIGDLRGGGIGAAIHYVPLHSSPAGRRLGRTAGKLKVTERIARTLVRLPLWSGMGDAELDRVCAAVAASVTRASARRRRREPAADALTS
jgi:dTDP-4-amino-4,6-dideoxygalactose transaminase